MDKILEKELPVYLNNFKIFDFDTSSIEKRYRIVSETCDIEINENVKKLLDFIALNEGKTSSFMIDKFSLDNTANKKNIEKTFSLLFKKGILNNEKQKEKEIKEEDFFRNKMKNFWFRFRIIDTEKHEQFFKYFSFVFSKPFVISILSLFFIFDAVFVYFYFFTTWTQHLIYYSALDYFYMFSIFGLVSLFLHETGHIAAAKRYNSKTGGIGIGIYYYMLVGYSDIHETWNLPRGQRRVVSIAGFYWNMISILPLYILCFYFNSKVIADFILLFHFSFLGIFDPFLKMDGYWFLCDTLGVPNLQNRIKAYFFQYLPSKYFRKVEEVINPFRSYPEKVLNGVKIYIIIFVTFMVFFISLFLLKAINIGLNLDTEIINPLKMIIAKWDSDLFNKLLRNGFILFGAIMLLIGYGGKYFIIFIKKLFSKKNNLITE